jgi:hypothetical protein
MLLMLDAFRSSENHLHSDDRQSSGSHEDCYFSADIETDGPIPGPYSMLSFALVYAGKFDGHKFTRPLSYNRTFYKELRPISESYEQEALNVNQLDRQRLIGEGCDPSAAMTEAAEWVSSVAERSVPILVAYPLSFDWTWLYWYFVRYSALGSPFGHSRCFDIKTAIAIKEKIPVCNAGRAQIRHSLHSKHAHTHHAVDDAIAQAEIFANVFELGEDGAANSI